MANIDPHRVLSIRHGASREQIDAAYAKALDSCDSANQFPWVREVVDSAYQELTNPRKSSGLAKNAFSRQLPLQNETTYFILVNVLDLFLTYILLAVGAIEANPIADFFYAKWGFNGMIAYKMVLVAFVCTLSQIVAKRNMRYGRGILWAGIAIVGLVVIYSVRLLVGQM